MNHHTDVHASLRYPALIRSIHWLTLLLIVAAYELIELRELFPKDSDPRAAMKYWHFVVGLTVFSLTVLRLGLRHGLTPPTIQPAMPLWQVQLAHGVHGLLYVWLLLMPLLGWLTLYVSGKPLLLLGFELPVLDPANKGLGKTIKTVHEACGNFGYLLIGAHALAALGHHYLMGDNTLRRMLPGRD